MNRLEYKTYFAHPVEALHRKYEALRSVFVEEQPMKEVAQRYQVSYGTIRNWVSEFRQGQAAGQLPPFSPPHHAGVLRPMNSMTRIRKSKSPMFRRYRWKRDVG